MTVDQKRVFVILAFALIDVTWILLTHHAIPDVTEPPPMLPTADLYYAEADCTGRGWFLAHDIYPATTSATYLTPDWMEYLAVTDETTTMRVASALRETGCTNFETTTEIDAIDALPMQYDGT